MVLGTAQASTWQRLEKWLVVLIAVHSYGVACALTFLTEWSARLLGFDTVTPLFFARQAGAFHFVVATAYLIEYFRYRGVTILVTTKTTAFIFLAAVWLTEGGAWPLSASMVSDGAMGTVVLLVNRLRPALAPSRPAL